MTNKCKCGIEQLTHSDYDTQKKAKTNMVAWWQVYKSKDPRC